MRIIYFVFLLIIFHPNLTAQAIQAPNLFCIKGDSLMYNPPNNSCGAFIEYEIYGSQK